MNRRIILVSDILDPSKGSEFRVPLISLNYLKQKVSSKIYLLTTKRLDNEKTIREWLKQNDLEKKVELKLFKFRRMRTNGSHKNKFMFILDLIDFYKYASNFINEKDIVWKTGQLHCFFYLLSSLFFKSSIMGPMAGFEIPDFYNIFPIPKKIKLKYFLYSLSIIVLNFLFILAKFLIFKKSVICLFGIKKDMNLFPKSMRNNFTHMIECLPRREDEIFKVNNSKASRDINILWSGALIYRKNPILALLIIEKLITKYPNVKLSIYGSGPLKNIIQKKINNFPKYIKRNIFYREKVDRQEFLKKFSKFDILLVTSFREGNSFLIIEALENNMFVVSPKLSGMNDTIQNKNHLFKYQGKFTIQNALTVLEKIIINKKECQNKNYLKKLFIKNNKSLNVLIDNYLEEINDPIHKNQ